MSTFGASFFVSPEIESQFWRTKRSFRYPEVFVQPVSLALRDSAESQYRSYDRSRWTRPSFKKADDMDFDQEKNDRDGSVF